VTPDPKPLPSRRVADAAQAELVYHDLVLYGHAFIDERGRRVDPDTFVAPDGRTATDGRRLFRPSGLDPARIRDREALTRARLRFRSCAACGASAGGIHHIVQKGSPHFGDDVEANLVGLCGSGSDRCHGAIHGAPYEVYTDRWLVYERRDQRWVAERIGRHLLEHRPDSIEYVLAKIGESAGREFLRRTYHVDLT
jgi:hypothetical protein